MNDRLRLKAGAGRAIAMVVAYVVTLAIIAVIIICQRLEGSNGDDLPNTGLTLEELNMDGDINLSPMGFDVWIESLCELYGVDSNIVRAIIERESGGDPTAVNPESGAAGLMQIVPGTWEAQTTSMRLRFALCPDEFRMNPLDSYDNVRVGVWLLAELKQKYPDAMPYALDCYALGEGGAEERLLRMQDYEPTAWTQAVLDRAAELLIKRAGITEAELFVKAEQK